MHLLVLSAFRLVGGEDWNFLFFGLNAPFGAQCFPTFWVEIEPEAPYERLNAPFGAQCFPTRVAVMVKRVVGLIVSQCTFWCSVLSDN